jgi:hypothetical protein
MSSDVQRARAPEGPLSRHWGRLLDAFGLAAALMLLALMLVICADVLLRNLPIIPSMRGIGAAIDLSEAALYLITLLSAPGCCAGGCTSGSTSSCARFPGDGPGSWSGS